MKFKAFLLALGCAVLIALPAFAQGNPTGKLTGRVTSDGQPLPGLTVTVSSPSLQGTRSTVTSSNGDYLFPSLPAGEYKVTYELQGLETVTKNVTLAAAQTQTQDVVMAVTRLEEEIVVTGNLETISQGSQAATTYSKTLVDALPVGRSVSEIVNLSPGVSATGPGKSSGTGIASIVISGAPSYENLFLVNGVVVNENLRGQPFDLFIEDAIQETTTATAGVSAEFGRFSGGVVNVITKSGGNKFSGSFRAGLTNQDWIADTPTNKVNPKKDEIVPTYEGTLGGPILRDRLWFFLAGRQFESESTNTTAAPTSIPFDVVRDQKRYEGKLTYSLTPSHTVIGSYIDIEDNEDGNFFSTILDRASLVNRETPQTLLSGNYTGIISQNLFLTAQYSEREFLFVGSGATSRDIINGTLMLDQSRSNARYWSPTFCGVCKDEERSNENYLGKASYFLSTEKAGTHDFVVGYDRFNDIRASDNHQSGSDYRVFGTGAIIRGESISPVFDENTVIQFNPIFLETKGTNFITNSYFVNDSWRLNDRLSLNIGLRYDANDGSNAEGNKVAKDSNISPRVALSFDPKGTGDWLFNASYGKYVAAIANSVGDSTSLAGVPATLQWQYSGPTVNLGNPANPVGTADALRTLFNWFNSTGGPNNTADLIFVSIPGANSVIRDSLDSPNVVEYTVGVTKQLGGRGVVRADVIHRDYADFYSTVANLSTGRVQTPQGVADLSLIQNDNSAFERTYDAVQTQFRYRLNDKIDFGGNYTWSHLRGNFDGETRNNGPVTGDLTFPEYKRPEWNRPEGDLSADQRHKASLYGVWRVFNNDYHNLNVSLLESFASGLPYGAVGTARTRDAANRFYIQNPGYVTPPTTVAYAYTAIDAYRTDDILHTDISINYGFKLKGVEIYIRPEVRNLFNEDGLDTIDTRYLNLTVFSAANTGATSCSRGGANGTPGRCQPFNPYTETPVEGVHWQKGPLFGQPISTFGYQAARTYRFAVGLRF